MSPSDLLTARPVTAARQLLASRPLRRAAATVTAGAGFAGALILTLVPSADSDLGRCPQCGNRVLPTDPFLRYRGDYYHAHDCIEFDPPAIRRAEARHAVTTDEAG